MKNNRTILLLEMLFIYITVEGEYTMGNEYYISLRKEILKKGLSLAAQTMCFMQYYTHEDSVIVQEYLDQFHPSKGGDCPEDDTLWLSNQITIEVTERLNFLMN